jgi:hypothetical protein
VGSGRETPYIPRRNIRSDGLTLAAITRTSTSVGPGFGTGRSTSTSEPGSNFVSRISKARIVAGISATLMRGAPS